MIRHVVMWKFREQNKQEHMDMFKEMLLSLKDEIEGIINMSAGEDLNDSDWDMALVMDVESLDALSRYKEHPKHQIVSKFCSRIRIKRSAVDFKISS